MTQAERRPFVIDEPADHEAAELQCDGGQRVNDHKGERLHGFWLLCMSADCDHRAHVAASKSRKFAKTAALFDGSGGTASSLRTASRAVSARNLSVRPHVDLQHAL